jgi:hypothetical protein
MITGSSAGNPLVRKALPRIAVPCGRRALSATERRQTFAAYGVRRLAAAVGSKL